MGRVLGVIALVVVASIISFTMGVKRGVEKPQPSEPGTEIVTIDVAALGRLEPMNGIVNVSALPGDLIDEVKVEEGDTIEPKQTLVTLKSRQLRSIEKDLASARLEEAKQRIEVEKEVAQSKLEAAQLAAREAKLKQQELNREVANLDLLRKQLAQAEESLKRLKRLADDPVTREVASPVDIDKQTLMVEKLRNDLQQGEAALESGREAQQLAIEAAQSQVDAAKLALESVEKASPLGALQRAVDLAELNFDMTNVVAPISSQAVAGGGADKPNDARLTVLRVMAQSGERVANMPLMQLGDVSQMACVAEVYEANLRDIELGLKATMSSPALEEELKGTVVKKGLVIGRPSLPNPNPLSRQDVRTAEVIIQLDKDSSKRAERLINLQVDVRIHKESDADGAEGANSSDDGEASNHVDD